MGLSAERFAQAAPPAGDRPVGRAGVSLMPAGTRPIAPRLHVGAAIAGQHLARCEVLWQEAHNSRGPSAAEAACPNSLVGSMQAISAGSPAP